MTRGRFRAWPATTHLCLAICTFLHRTGSLLNKGRGLIQVFAVACEYPSLPSDKCLGMDSIRSRPRCLAKSRSGIPFFFLCSPQGAAPTNFETGSTTQFRMVAKHIPSGLSFQLPVFPLVKHATPPGPAQAPPRLPCFREHFRSVTCVKGPRPRIRACPSRGRRIGGAPPAGLSSHRRPWASSLAILGVGLKGNRETGLSGSPQLLQEVPPPPALSTRNSLLPLKVPEVPPTRWPRE